MPKTRRPSSSRSPAGRGNSPSRAAGGVGEPGCGAAVLLCVAGLLPPGLILAPRIVDVVPLPSTVQPISVPDRVPADGPDAAS